MTKTKRSLQEEVVGWFAGRLPDGWFTEAPAVSVDGEEILVVGRVAEPEAPADASLETACLARIKRFREETRERRMDIAEDAQRLFGRRVSWGAVCGDQRRLFTTVSSPVMTRLRMPERNVLDTLVDAGVARSRSEALAWCVRLVGKHEAEWIDGLREALTHVERARAEGPTPV